MRNFDPVQAPIFSGAPVLRCLPLMTKAQALCRHDTLGLWKCPRMIQIVPQPCKWRVFLLFKHECRQDISLGTDLMQIRYRWPIYFDSFYIFTILSSTMLLLSVNHVLRFPILFKTTNTTITIENITRPTNNAKHR